jgi:hypothetical protein
LNNFATVQQHSRHHIPLSVNFSRHFLSHNSRTHRLRVVSTQIVNGFWDGVTQLDLIGSDGDYFFNDISHEAYAEYIK